MGETGNKDILLCFLSTCYYKTSFFVTGHHAIRKTQYLKFTSVACCVNFYSVALYNSAVMEFWPFTLELRIKLVISLSHNYVSIC